MAFYIQYDQDGNITGTVLTDGTAPACENQLVFDAPQITQGKQVDLATLTLIDIIIDPNNPL